MEDSSHEPVLLDEVMTALNIHPEGLYLDATFGRGGHSLEILKRLGAGGRLIGLDRDQAAIDHAVRIFAGEPRFRAVKSSFSKLNDVLPALIGGEKFDGVLFDLGVSSPQLDQANRGFSFRHDGPLDMRMDQHGGPSAAEWLAHAEEWEIRKVLRQFGEERYAGRIAREIVSRREVQPINTTAQLAQLVMDVAPTREREKHPATRVFQAIRIQVNHELDEIRQVLPAVLDWLKPRGRMAVISFHSLEDRIVKRFIRDAAKGDHYPLDLAVTSDMLDPQLKSLGKPVKASARQIESNPRARSAVLRAAQKTGPRS